MRKGTAEETLRSLRVLAIFSGVGFLLFMALVAVGVSRIVG